MTLYEEVHPQSSATSLTVHQAFLTQLATMLPPACVPILITDAGFRGVWFRLVNRMGWYWIGRIRNRDMVSLANNDTWVGCKTLYVLAMGTAKSLGQSTQKNRLGVLLLVACLASFVLRLIGEVGKTRQMEFQFQSNTRRSRPVLSVISLALQLVQHGMAAFPPREFREALESLRYDHPVL